MTGLVWWVRVSETASWWHHPLFTSVKLEDEQRI